MCEGSSVFLFLWKDLGTFARGSYFQCLLLMVMTRWLLGCPEIALVCLQFCSVPDTIAFYSVGHHHWASYVASCAHALIPLLWNFDKITLILEDYLCAVCSPQCHLVSECAESLHRWVCAHLYRRYAYLVDHCQPGYMSPHLNLQLLELPLTSWTEHQVTIIASENCLLRLCMKICSNLDVCLRCMAWGWIGMFLGSCLLGAVYMQRWQLVISCFRHLMDGASWQESFSLTEIPLQHVRVK